MKLLQNLRHATIALAIGLFATCPRLPFLRQWHKRVDDTSSVLSPEELFNRLSRSVFVVEVLDENGSLIAFGSGVAVTPNQVVTNKHVIDGGATLRIKQGSRSWPAGRHVP